MGKANTVLLDYDGTLMNTNEVVIQSWQYTFRTVEGKERPLDDILKSFGEPLSVTMKKLLPQIRPEEGIKIYRSFMVENYEKMIYPFPGMVELVKELKQRGYKTGLVTSRIAETTRIGMDKFGLTSFFDCMVTADDTSKHKPDPEPLLIALEKLSSNASESVMVGDSRFDILSARNAGIKSILVGWQRSMREEEIKGPDGPDHIIQKAEELLYILN
jgi:pyrophosphatase PpaX